MLKKLNFIKTPNWIKKFFYSDVYLFIIALSMFLSWSMHQPIFGFLAIGILGALTLILIDDISPTLPIIIMSVCMIFTTDINAFIYYTPCFIPIIIGVIFHFIYYPVSIKKGKMFWPQIAITIAMLLGGCNVIAKDLYVKAVPFILILGLLVLAVYMLFNSYYMENEYIKSSTYFARVLMWLGILLSAEIAFHYIHNRIGISQWNEEWINLGWGLDNNVALLLLLSAPMCFYLSFTSTKNEQNYVYRTRKLGWIYVLIGYLQYATMCFTFSRGGILFSIVTFPFILGFTIAKSKNKLNIIIPTLLCFIGAFAIYFAYFDKINHMFAKMFEGGGAGWANRDTLYLEAIECFKNNPIFGCGLAYEGIFIHDMTMPVYFFHSTLFEIVGALGIAGIIIYLYYYIVRFKIMFTKITKNAFSLFALFSIIGFELYSMLDTGTFLPYPFMMIVLLFTMYVERENQIVISKNLNTSCIKYEKR